MQALRGKQKLSPGEDTVLIGYKDSFSMRTRVQHAAQKMGITYSEFLRSVVNQSVERVESLTMETENVDPPELEQ